MFGLSNAGPRQLSRYWAALVAGASRDELDQLAKRLDPEMVETIARVRTTAYKPIPDPDFVARLEQKLVGQLARGETSGMNSEMALPIRIAPPRGGVPSLIRLVSVVSACLLLLLVGYALWLYGARDPEPMPGVLVPATSVPTPVATPIPQEETLLHVVIPADRIPTGDGRLAGLNYIYIESGASGAWTGTCCSGPMIEVIVSGNLTVTSRVPVQVLRSNGQLEEIAADIEFVLNPGDTWITRNRSTFLSANNGAVPVEMVEWIYLDDPYGSFAGHTLPGWGGPGGLDVTNQVPEFTGDIELTLRRLNLEPDEGEDVPSPGTFRQVVVPDLQTEILRYFGDDAFGAINSDGDMTTVYVLDVTSANTNTDLPVVGLPPE